MNRRDGSIRQLGRMVYFVRPWAILLSTAVVVLLGVARLGAAADWPATLTKEPPGKFPPLRSVRARYSFGWSGITAATGDARFTRSNDDRDILEASGRTIGLVRALWRFDVTQHAVADATTLRPVEMKQVETTRGKAVTTTLSFNSAGVVRSRTDTSAKSGPPKPKRFDFANMFDLQSGALYLRSQPLNDHTVYRIVVYPATNAYLATVTVTGRERISVRAGSYNAIKLDLQLSRVGEHLELQPHKKFRHATIWVSDDSDRVILRVEAQIFVGTVFAELHSLQFEK